MDSKKIKNSNDGSSQFAILNQTRYDISKLTFKGEIVHNKYSHNFTLIFLFLSLSSFFYADQLTAERNHNLTLQNGKSVSLRKIIYNEPKIIRDGVNINSAIIKSFDTEIIDSKDLISYVNMTSLERTFGYFSIVPGRQISYGHLIPTTARIYSLVDKDEGARWYHQYQDEFKSYYHNVFSNKVARKLLFKFTLDLLIEACEYWPKDFKAAVLSELDRLLVSIPKIANLSESEFSKQILFNRKYNYLHGLIYRRIKTDKMPINEAIEYLRTTKNALNNLSTESQPDIMTAIHINGEITIYVGADNQYYLYSKSNSKLLKIEPSHIIESVKFLSGDDGKFYQMAVHKKGKGDQTHLYDTDLNMIY